MIGRRIPCFLLTGMIAVAACTKPDVTVSAQVEPIEPFTTGSAVVLNLSGWKLRPVTDCVEEEIRQSVADITLVEESEFRDATYPWFETATFPTSDAAVDKLMHRGLLREKLTELGVRFVIGVVGSHTATVQKWGGTAVGPGPGGGMGVALGGQTQRKWTSANAVVIDFESGKSVADLSAAASGEGGAGVIILVPYFTPIPDTEKIVCEDIAEQVTALLHGHPQDGS